MGAGGGSLWAHTFFYPPTAITPPNTTFFKCGRRPRWVSSVFDPWLGPGHRVLGHVGFLPGFVVNYRFKQTNPPSTDGPAMRKSLPVRQVQRCQLAPLIVQRPLFRLPTERDPRPISPSFRHRLPFWHDTASVSKTRASSEIAPFFLRIIPSHGYTSPRRRKRHWGRARPPQWTTAYTDDCQFGIQGLLRAEDPFARGAVLVTLAKITKSASAVVAQDLPLVLRHILVEHVHRLADPPTRSSA